jgi:hypothetical protein
VQAGGQGTLGGQVVFQGQDAARPGYARMRDACVLREVTLLALTQAIEDEPCPQAEQPEGSVKT